MTEKKQIPSGCRNQLMAIVFLSFFYSGTLFPSENIYKEKSSHKDFYDVVTTIVSRFFDELGDGSNAEFDYVSESYKSEWAESLTFYNPTIVDIGFSREEEVYYAVVELFDLKKEAISHIDPHVDVVYLKKDNDTFKIKDGYTLPSLEDNIQRNFDKRMKFGRRIDIRKRMLSREKLIFKDSAKPVNMNNDQWEREWEKYWDEYKDKDKDHQKHLSFADLFEKHEIIRVDSDYVGIYDLRPLAFKSLKDSVKSYITLDLLKIKKYDYFASAWKWNDEDVLNIRKRSMGMYTGSLVSFYSLAITGLIEYKLHFVVDATHNNESYKIGFVSFRQSDSPYFQLVKSDYSLQNKYIGLSVFLFKKKEGKWILMKEQNSFLGLEHILYELKLNGFNNLYSRKPNDVKEKLQKLELPDDITEDILE